MMNRRGFSLIEILTALVLVGILAGLGFPRISQALRKENVRGAAAAVGAMHGRTRAIAINRGREAKLVLTDGNLKIISTNPVTGATVVVASQNIASQFNVTVTPSRDTLKFDARGLGEETSATTVVVSNSAASRTVNISSIGRIVD